MGSASGPFITVSHSVNVAKLRYSYRNLSFIHCMIVLYLKCSVNMVTNKSPRKISLTVCIDTVVSSLWKFQDFIFLMLFEHGFSLYSYWLCLTYLFFISFIDDTCKVKLLKSGLLETFGDVDAVNVTICNSSLTCAQSLPWKLANKSSWWHAQISAERYPQVLVDTPKGRNVTVMRQGWKPTCDKWNRFLVWRCCGTWLFLCHFQPCKILLM